MTWVKLDDRFCDNPKVAALTDKAFRAHVTALCYSSGALSDGFIPPLHAAAFTTKRPVVDELVKAGLWERIPTGFLIHDYLEYQRNRAGILAERRADLARKNGGNPRGKS